MVSVGAIPWLEAEGVAGVEHFALVALSGRKRGAIDMNMDRRWKRTNWGTDLKYDCPVAFVGDCPLFESKCRRRVEKEERGVGGGGWGWGEFHLNSKPHKSFQKKKKKKKKKLMLHEGFYIFELVALALQKLFCEQRRQETEHGINGNSIYEGLTPTLTLNLTLISTRTNNLFCKECTSTFTSVFLNFLNFLSVVASYTCCYIKRRFQIQIDRGVLASYGR
jgi:hypothetical protein